MLQPGANASYPPNTWWAAFAQSTDEQVCTLALERSDFVNAFTCVIQHAQAARALVYVDIAMAPRPPLGAVAAVPFWIIEGDVARRAVQAMTATAFVAHCLAMITLEAEGANAPVSIRFT